MSRIESHSLFYVISPCPCTYRYLFNLNPKMFIGDGAKLVRDAFELAKEKCKDQSKVCLLRSVISISSVTTRFIELKWCTNNGVYASLPSETFMYTDVDRQDQFAVH